MAGFFTYWNQLGSREYSVHVVDKETERRRLRKCEEAEEHGPATPFIMPHSFLQLPEADQPRAEERPGKVSPFLSARLPCFCMLAGPALELPAGLDSKVPGNGSRAQGLARGIGWRSYLPPPFCETSDPKSQHSPSELLLLVIVTGDLEMRTRLWLPELPRPPAVLRP